MTSRTSHVNSNPNRRGTAPSLLAISSSNQSSSNLSRTNSSTNGPTPHPKQTISVEEWERKAPLSDLQLRSVAQVTRAGEALPLPLKFAEEKESKSTPGTPTQPRPLNKYLQQYQKDTSRPGTPGSPGTPRAGNAASSTHALHPSNPVQTPQQFYDWFALIDRSVARSQEAHYWAHLSSLDDHLGVCDLLLKRIGEVETDVQGMLEGWRGVEEGGKSLKGACERLLEERDGLLELVEDIGSHLEYFQELEHATRMLNHPGESLIFQADFHYMVERVDICIDFLKGHRHYREAEVYLLRFQQCMTRAMTLIKMNFVGSLRALSSEISKRISENDVSSTAQHHLLYTRFHSVSTKVAPLLGELEGRAQAYPDELGSLLAECHTAYFTTRKGLLVPRILEEIKGLDPGRSELVELTRSGCSYLKQLCTDEFNLYREFFSTAQDQLYQYLETLCDLLYDDLRPRILHEPRLTVLCEVCTVLQALMVLDATTTSSSSSVASSTVASSDSEDDDSEETDSEADGSTSSIVAQKRPARARRDSDELTVNLQDPDSQSVVAKGGKLGKSLHTGHLLKMVLQDAQTRLFFKAQAVVQSEIRHYVPSADELKWPDVLLAANKPPTSAFLTEKQSTSQIFDSVPALSRQDTWYPTLRRTVWVLSQLRDFVKPAIFEDIAQEAVGVCHTSLVSASDSIRTQTGKEKPLDGALFLVRHLLILKEVLSSLEVDLRARAEDGEGLGLRPSGSGGRSGTGSGTTNLKSPMGSRFEVGGMVTSGGGGVTETLTNMLSKTTSLLPEGLFASLGVARGPENDLRGVKLDIDQSLRKACEDVIAATSRPVCEPLQNWVDRMAAIKSPGGGAPLNSGPPSTVTSLPSVAEGGVQPNLDVLLSSAPQTHTSFIEALQRDLRSAVARVKLYLEDERTVKVLLEHVVDRVGVVYERFGDAIFNVKKANLGSGTSGGLEGLEILSSSSLREMLRDVCGTSSLSFSGYGKV